MALEAMNLSPITPPLMGKECNKSEIKKPSLDGGQSPSRALVPPPSKYFCYHDTGLSILSSSNTLFKKQNFLTFHNVFNGRSFTIN